MAAVSKGIDSLDPQLADLVAAELDAMLPYVDQLERAQQEGEWLSYKTPTKHPAGLSVGDVVGKLAERLQSLKVYVSRSGGRVGRGRVG